MSRSGAMGSSSGAAWLTKTDAAGTYALRSRVGTALVRELDAAAQSQAISIVTDSTGNAAGAWPESLAAQLAARYPAYTVRRLQWSDATQNFAAPVVVQVGTGGAPRGLTVAGACPRYTAASITGDLDVSACVTPTSWKAGAATSTVAAKAGGAPTRGWHFDLNTNGTLSLYWSVDGTAQLVATSTVAVPFSGNTLGWVRAVLDVDNGSAGNTVTFYTSTDGAAWTTLGAAVTQAGVTSIFDNTTIPYEVGGFVTTVNLFLGLVHEVWVRSGILGPTVIPVLPELLNKVSTAAVGTMSGAPILTIIQGGAIGQNIAYFDDPTRRPKMLPYFGQSIVVLASSHNDLVNIGDQWAAMLGTWIDNTQARLPYATVVLSTQNPEASPRSDVLIDAHRNRREVTLRAAAQRRLDVIDGYKAVTSLNADGLHPLVPTGYTQWANEAMLLFPASGS